MKRVLIVDDAIDLGRMLQDALKMVHPDIPITVVPSAEEALLESSRYMYDLLVADLRLPGMSGTELIRKIRVRQPHVKVIMITGMAQDERLARQREEAKPDIFMHKPITASAFLDAVEQLIGEGKEPETQQPQKPETQPQSAAQQNVAKETAAVLKEMASVMPGVAVESKKTHPLGTRKTTGSLPAEPQVTEGEGLSAILSRLRGELSAISATLLDERGHPVAQAGDLPELSQGGQLLSQIMASLSAGIKVSYALGQAASQSVQAYRGANFDLVIAPVAQYALVISLRPGRTSLRLALAFEEASSAQVELTAALEAMGLRMQVTGEVAAPEMMLNEAEEEGEEQAEVIPPEILETPLGQDPGLEKFEELFSKKKTGQLNMQDPDSFWDALSNGESGEVSQPGVLSFDQALKLGLVPPDQHE